METLPLETLYDITSHMNPRDILKLCQSSRYFYDQLCSNEILRPWYHLYKQFSSSEHPSWTEQDYRKHYFEIINDLETENPALDEYSSKKDINAIMVALKHNADLLLYDLLIKFSQENPSWNDFYNLTKSLDEYTYLRDNPREALRVLVNYLLSRGETVESLFLEGLLTDAIQQNRLDIVEDLLSVGIQPADDEEVVHYTVFNDESNPRMVDMLMSHVKYLDPEYLEVYRAIRNLNVEKLKTLLNNNEIDEDLARFIVGIFDRGFENVTAEQIPIIQEIANVIVPYINSLKISNVIVSKSKRQFKEQIIHIQVL